MKNQVNNAFIIRHASPQDAEGILQAHRAAVRGSAVEFYSREVIEEWAPLYISAERIEGLARTIAGGNEIVVVALDSSDKILGFGSIVPGNGELRAVYVRSEQGRKGVGRAILRRLEELAREAGLTELWMDASINAEAFYSKRLYRWSAWRAHDEDRRSDGVCPDEQAMSILTVRQRESALMTLNSSIGHSLLMASSRHRCGEASLA